MEPVEILTKSGTEHSAPRYELHCPYCNAVLAVIYRSSTAYQFFRGDDCEHFYWIPVGNLCWENPDISDVCRGIREIKKRAVKHYYDGTTVWILVPNEGM